jgi:23S rRNA (cytidine1920-2'-O)/16S rRNA (cytidine1409-2'-O)-methyltransferase
MKKKGRLDKLLVERGLVMSRERARALIMEGKIAVGGLVVMKSGTMVPETAEIVLRDRDIPFVGRGGLKLEAALDFFAIKTTGKIAMDIGCSTGGFTDCLLKRGTSKVYAIDVGYGQFDWSLRQNPKVVLMERTNIRYLEKDRIAEPIELIVIDVSFISLLKVLPKAHEFLGEDGEVLALVKPQFEVGKGMVGKGGIVRDELLRAEAVRGVREGAERTGFRGRGVYESPVPGQKGNKEYFLYLVRS